MTLGQKLKQTRLARGMTQSQVVGDRITRNMLSQIENDLASPSVGTLEYLASVLNVRLSWLLADEQEEAEAGRTQRLRELLKSGEYAACLELAPEHAPDDEQALALARRVSLPEELLDRYPTHISGGEQQRVAIARGLTMDRRLLLADEPTGNLDSENSDNIIDLLLKLAHDENRCVIVVTHDLSVMDRADVVYRINDGLLERR